VGGTPQADLLTAERGREAARATVKTAKAQHRTIKVRRRGARGPAIVDEHGNPLTTEALQALAATHREVAPSYVSQSPNARSPIAYYRASAAEPTIGSRARTERPTLEGTFDAHPEMLRARAMAAQGMVSAATNFRSFIAETALRGNDGAVITSLTRERAETIKRDLAATSGHEFDLVAVRPWAATHEHIQALTDDINAGGDFDPRALQAFRDSLAAAYDGKGDGPFALVPSAAVKQARQFLRTLDPADFGRGARALRSSFTRTVLTTSPGPTFGNIVEPIVRAGVQRAGPLSAVRGLRVRRALRELDAVIGRGKITLASQRRYTDPRQFDEGTVRSIVAGWQALKGAPVAKQLVGAWDLWTRIVFEQVNGRAEAFFREGPMLGKVLKDSGLMDHTLMALSTKAMREAAEGLRDTATQAQVAAKLNDAYGKYQGFSPTGKRVIGDFTPFAAWWLSSATFILKVLPRDHPALLALTASAEQATEQWRRAQGLDLFQGEGRLPGWLQGTVAAGAHGRVKLAYNTPFGVATDPLASASSLVFPQGENLLNAFQGLDWKNAKLRNPDGTEYDEIQKALYAAGELLKSTVPAVAVPVKVKRYVKNPNALLNPVLVPPRKPKIRKVRATSQRAIPGALPDYLTNDPTQRDINALLEGMP
jgi:hypothetical protein